MDQRPMICSDFLVLDKTRYQRSAVQALAARVGIPLLFLPSYSPEPNLIGRPWKVTKSIFCPQFGALDSAMCWTTEVVVIKGCRVEVWRGGLGRCLCSRLARSFVCGCHIISTMLRFHTPLIKPGGRFSRTRLSDKAC